MKVSSSQTREVRREIRLDEKDIVAFLAAQGVETEGWTARVVYQVPGGGGDYSNCRVDVSAEDPIIVILEKKCHE